MLVVNNPVNAVSAIKMKVVLYAPALAENNASVHDVHDGELLYLGQYLYNLGYTVRVIDCYAKPQTKENIVKSIASFSADILIVHLWKNAFLKDNRLNEIINNIKDLKKALKLKYVVGIGNIAVSLQEELLNYDETFDTIISELKIFSRNNHIIEDFFLIKDYYKGFSALSENYLNDSKILFDTHDIVSVFSSRGCKKGCSFCSYNKDVSKWRDRSIKDLYNDITIIQDKFNVSNFGLYDSNFGNDANLNIEKTKEMATYFKNKEMSLALNISLDGLNEKVIKNLQKSKVKAILVGLESLSENTLEYVYNKPQSLNHSLNMIELCEKNKIIPIVSYILFNPYMSYDDLIEEVNRIEEFGRYRITQFLSRSVVQVMPATKMEKMLERDNLLIKKDIFYRDFVFLDKNVKEIYDKINVFYKRNIKNYNQNAYTLSEFKYKEWLYLKSII